MNARFPTVTFRAGPVGVREVLLDGVPVPKVRRLKIEASYDDVTEVTITLLAQVEGTLADGTTVVHTQSEAEAP